MHIMKYKFIDQSNYIGLIMDNELTPEPNSDFSYIRPDGAYYDELKKRRNVNGFNNITKFDTYVNLLSE